MSRGRDSKPSNARRACGSRRMNGRLWLTVYGIVGVILAQALQSVLDVVP